MDLGFTYELNRVDDPKFGTHIVYGTKLISSYVRILQFKLVSQNGRWNGLMGALANRRVDMVMTSLTVNAERENAADFTIPFMETGIAILVAKRTGIISPTAFLGYSAIQFYIRKEVISLDSNCCVIYRAFRYGFVAAGGRCGHSGGRSGYIPFRVALTIRLQHAGKCIF